KEATSRSRPCAPTRKAAYRATMRERVQKSLERVVGDSASESAWLHTLSLLEYIGARKIARTAAVHHPPLEILQHWADETRHAAVLEALAVKLGGGRASSYLCGDAAKKYFAELDQTLAHWAIQSTGIGTERPEFSYLLVTAVIERRAMMLYPVYR